MLQRQNRNGSGLRHVERVEIVQDVWIARVLGQRGIVVFARLGDADLQVLSIAPIALQGGSVSHLFDHDFVSAHGEVDAPQPVLRSTCASWEIDPPCPSFPAGERNPGAAAFTVWDEASGKSRKFG